jgi:hypothetical protein
MISHGDNAGRTRLKHADRDTDSQAHLMQTMDKLRRAVDFTNLRVIAGAE